MYLNYFCLALSFFLLVTYLYTKKYTSWNGALMLITVLIILILKLKMGTGLLYSKDTLLQSGILTLAFTLIFSGAIIPLKKKKQVSTKYILLLFTLYLVFGFVQQLFFQYIFLETIFNLSNSFLFSIIITTVFYGYFHLQYKLFFIGTMLVNHVWSTIYLRYGNIIWPALSHAILATLFYILIYDKDPIREKLNF